MCCLHSETIIFQNSLTSVLYKVTESIVRELVSDLESNHRLTSRQHGFMKGRSCLTNLLETFVARHMH